ncbi:hypothetical protein XH89_25620 [Bradyrhizobium sp. CCBAU 53340]|nr:hypothetical protein XH89_25620 [Bradyrhizobium sp. CCBAU 53340]
MRRVYLRQAEFLDGFTLEDDSNQSSWIRWPFHSKRRDVGPIVIAKLSIAGESPAANQAEVGGMLVGSPYRDVDPFRHGPIAPKQVGDSFSVQWSHAAAIFLYIVWKYDLLGPQWMFVIRAVELCPIEPAVRKKVADIAGSEIPATTARGC